MSEGLRLRQRGDLHFAFNYTANSREAPIPEGAEIVLGNRTIPAYDLVIWRQR